MSERRLCSNDPNKELEFRIYNYASNGKHEIIGSVVFRLSAFKMGGKYDIFNKSKNAAGTLVL